MIVKRFQMMLCLDELFVFLVPRISRSCNYLRKKIFNEDFDGILALGEFEYRSIIGPPCRTAISEGNQIYYEFLHDSLWKIHIKKFHTPILGGSIEINPSIGTTNQRSLASDVTLNQECDNVKRCR